MYKFDIKEVNEKLAKLNPFERVKWARDTFGDKFCITSSFGRQAAIMAHIISEADKKIPILFLDTGYHFAETLAYKEYLQKRFDLNIVEVKPDLLRMEFEEKYGYAYESDQDLCCMQRKVIPLRHALENYDCWATGVRREQTSERKNLNILTGHKDKQHSFKLAPIADYSANDVALHYELYKLPEHPLVRKGYVSIGCYPCTDPGATDEDERAGRWRGRANKECGIHLLHGQGEGI